MTIQLPGPNTRWRCSQCGNLTRFDVQRTAQTREYWHQDLSGAATVEESSTLSETVESVTCRWCGASNAITLVPRPSEAEIHEAQQ